MADIRFGKRNIYHDVCRRRVVDNLCVHSNTKPMCAASHSRDLNNDAHRMSSRRMAKQQTSALHNPEKHNVDVENTKSNIVGGSEYQSQVVPEELYRKGS